MNKNSNYLQFFSREVASVMELYSIHTNYIPDGESTRKFITRMSALIHAFSSRTPKGALTMQCPERDVSSYYKTIILITKFHTAYTIIHNKCILLGTISHEVCSVLTSDFKIKQCYYKVLVSKRFKKKIFFILFRS